MNRTFEWLRFYTERWHDTWEIVGSIATLLAVITALVIALVEGRARARTQADELERLRVERDEARREREVVEDAERQRAREAQARQVVIWAEIERDRNDLVLDVTTVNYSDAPIFSATVYVPEREPRFEFDRVIGVGENVGTLMPRGEHVGRARVAHAPHEGPHGPDGPRGELRRFEVGHQDPLLPHIAVVFRDAHGNWWRRAGDGALQTTEPWTPEESMPVDAHNPWQ
jgi:hypothetical protein